MIPVAITRLQARIAEAYWGCSWTFLSGEQVQEALDWYYAPRYAMRQSGKNTRERP